MIQSNNNNNNNNNNNMNNNNMNNNNKNTHTHNTQWLELHSTRRLCELKNKKELKAQSCNS